MDYQGILYLLSQIPLPKHTYVVVGGAVFVMLKDSWRQSTEDLDLVVLEEGMEILETLGWKTITGAVGAPIVVGEAAGIKIEANLDWGIWDSDLPGALEDGYEGNGYRFEDLEPEAFLVDGFKFASPETVAHWKFYNRSARTDLAGITKDNRDVEGWQEWERKYFLPFLLKNPQVNPVAAESLEYILRLLQTGKEGFGPHDPNASWYPRNILARLALSPAGRKILEERGIANENLVYSEEPEEPILWWVDFLRPGTIRFNNVNTLPPALRSTLEKAIWNPSSLPVDSISEEKFDSLIAELGGHNIHSAVDKRVLAQFNLRNEQGKTDPIGVVQGLRIAAYASSMADPLAKMELTTAVDIWAKENGVSLGMRILIAQSIDATTNRFQGPVTEFESMLRTAYIAPEEDFDPWVQQRLTDTYEQATIESPPSTLKGWITNQIDVLEQVKENLSPEGEALGWKHRAEQHQQRLRSMQNGEDPQRHRALALAWNAARRKRVVANPPPPTAGRKPRRPRGKGAPDLPPGPTSAKRPQRPHQ